MQHCADDNLVRMLERRSDQRTPFVVLVDFIAMCLQAQRPVLPVINERVQ